MEKNKFTIITPIEDITDISINQAERLFFVYKEKKIITDGVFSDDKWFMSDEYANYTLDFNINFDDYKEFGNFIGISIDDFKVYLKTFVISCMGSYVIGTIRTFIYHIKRFITYPLQDLEKINDVSFLVSLPHIVDFISILPKNGRDKQFDSILYHIDRIQEASFSLALKHQRSLAAFDSYFIFNEIINRFWAECKDEKEKIFYFPIWLWWNVSGIIPMRPREFLLTPRKCLSEVDDKYYLILRKNKIKGNSKTKSYKIADDYYTFKCEIPRKLVKEIQWYINVTKDYIDNELITLFLTDIHYAKWERCRPSNSRYYTYVNLTTCLRYFFSDIVCNRYGYRIVEHIDGKYLADNEINYLHLGDTRHIALINAILEGVTPVIAAILAGHDNPDMSAHYYSNISTLIECKTYRQFKSLIKGKQNYVISKPSNSLKVGKFILLDDNTRCYSARVREGDFCDCQKVCGPGGEIGYCQYCTYHRASDRPFHDAKDLYKNRLALECANLADIVSKVRRNLGEKEEIMQALLTLRDAGYSYQQYLFETKEK